MSVRTEPGVTTSPGDAAAWPGGPESAANCVSSSSLSVTNPVQSHFLKRQYEWLCMFSLIRYKLPTHYITAPSFTNRAAEFGKVGPVWSAVASSGFHSVLFIRSVLPNPNQIEAMILKSIYFYIAHEWVDKKRLPLLKDIQGQNVSLCRPMSKMFSTNCKADICWNDIHLKSGSNRKYFWRDTVHTVRWITLTVQYTGLFVDNVQKFTEIINGMWRKITITTPTHRVLQISSAAAR